jgi:hypothetical protein
LVVSVDDAIASIAITTDEKEQSKKRKNLQRTPFLCKYTKNRNNTF